MPDEEPSLNIPSLLTLAVVSFFVIRWFLNRDSEPGAGGGAGGRSRARGHAVDPAQVEQILQMFPQLNARDIMWDLQRNGGSVAATTERILSGRRLEVVSTCFRSTHYYFLLVAVQQLCDSIYREKRDSNAWCFCSLRRRSSRRFPSLRLLPTVPRRHAQRQRPAVRQSRKDRI